MSANLIVDIGNTAQFNLSLYSITGAQSGTQVGLPIDLQNADTFCNVTVAAGGVASGPLLFQVQTADGVSGVPWSGGGLPPSGNFTDPTSGLAQLPTWFSSGGILIVNSGFYPIPGGGGGSGTQVAGYPMGTFPFGTTPVQNAQGGPAVASGNIQEFASGGVAFAAFQRPNRFARINLLSGGTSASGLPVFAGFVSQLRTTGSGGGYSAQPLSGNVNV